jgi:hypothetical protein
MNRRLLLLIAVAVLLGSFLLFDGGGLPPAGERAVSTPAAEYTPPPADAVDGGPATLNPYQGLAERRFTNMLERPLFNPGRAGRPPEPVQTESEVAAPELPPEPPQPPEPPAPQAEDFMLVAVAAGPAGRVAAVRLASTGDVLYLRPGQPVDGWTVLAVNDKSVVIGTAERNVEVTLFDRDDTQAQEMQDAPLPGDPPLELPTEGGAVQ